MAKILLVEDDAGLCNMIVDWLSLEQHQVEVSFDGVDGLEKLVFFEYDAIILDWSLPGKDGIEVLYEFRNRGGLTPVLMLTGRNTILDKEAGLNTGADDYLTKPFHMKELSARLRALLRRPRTLVNEVLTVKGLRVDVASRKVSRDGREIKLLPTEFALLEFLMRHPGQVFSQEALLKRVWPSESEATAHALTSCVKRLRKAIDSPGEESLIANVYGVGYRLGGD